ncbi:co-chaperone GroES [Candidatus Babeliales bacterium]|nr:co-chaperone GroES [Candidatus Babeliales bacterium]
MAKTITPLHDRVVIKRLEEKQTTSGGIIIPDTAKEKTQFGEVVSTGPGKLSSSGEVKSLSVKSGDRVIFGKYSGTEIKFDGTELLIIKEDEILGILK